MILRFCQNYLTSIPIGMTIGGFIGTHDEIVKVKNRKFEEKLIAGFGGAAYGTMMGGTICAFSPLLLFVVPIAAIHHIIGKF